MQKMAPISSPVTLRPPFQLGQLNHWVTGTLEGDPEIVINGIASIEEAEPGDLVFAEDERHRQQAENSPASAVIVGLEAPPSTKSVIRVAKPRQAFSKILALFIPPLEVEAGVHPDVMLDATTRVAESATVMRGAVIGKRVKIGRNSIVHPLAYIGDDVTIGVDCVINPQVTICREVRIGNRVIIHPGAVIGSDGFGYVPLNGSLAKVPHIGTVEIGDDVEIGANVTIDRSKTGTTLIGTGTKIDNLVHIAHNVKIGAGCIIVAQVGIAGSVTVGQGAILAGQAGIKDHIQIGDGAVVLAQAGVIGDVESGARVSGYPARPHLQKLREQAMIAELPELRRRVKNLEKLIEELNIRTDDRR